MGGLGIRGSGGGRGGGFWGDGMFKGWMVKRGGERYGSGVSVAGSIN